MQRLRFCFFGGALGLSGFRLGFRITGIRVKDLGCRCKRAVV